MKLRLKGHSSGLKGHDKLRSQVVVRKSGAASNDESQDDSDGWTVDSEWMYRNTVHSTQKQVYLVARCCALHVGLTFNTLNSKCA